jgi:hypothetical protein
MTTISIIMLSASIILLGYIHYLQSKRINTLEDMIQSLMLSNMALMKSGTMLKQMLDENKILGGTAHDQEESTNH